MLDPLQSGDVLSDVPLFPLPSVVLLPQAVLPLHLFEERYKAMMAQALEGDRLIAMALLRPGWEKNYYGQPVIEPVVCVGTILTHERLDDGCYNLLLQGHTRAKIVGENMGSAPFRTARLNPLHESPATPAQAAACRLQLSEIFSDPRLVRTAVGEQFRNLLSGPLPTDRVADLIAFNFIEDLTQRQAILSEPIVHQRLDCIAAALREWLDRLPENKAGGHSQPSNN